MAVLLKWPARFNRKGGDKGRRKDIGAVVKPAAVTMIALALVLALVGLGFHLLQQQESEQSMLEQTRIGAEGVANRLSEYITNHSNLLTRYAQSPGLADLLKSGNQEELTTREQALLRLMQGAVRVRFLPLEWDRPDPAARPPFSFASLEMIRTVETSGLPSPAEVHQPGTPNKHIALAAPIKDGTGALVGVAHLVLPYEVLQRNVTERNDSPGLLMVQQVIANGIANLSRNKGEVIEGPAAGQIAVTGSIWQVAYWPSEPVGSLLQRPAFWGILVGGLVLIGLLLLQLSLRFGRTLRQETAPVPAGKTVPQHTEAIPVGPRESDGTEADKETRAALAEKLEALQPKMSKPVAPVTAVSLPASIFRAYDIRGVVDETLDAESVYLIGRAIGSAAREQGQQTVIIARDGRNSSQSLSEALARGLMESGQDVVDLGQVPTPVLYFATHFLGSDSGVMVTGSHNPPEYNGLKIVIGGEALSGQRIQDLRQRIGSGNLLQGEGVLQAQDLLPDYINRIIEDVQLLAPLKVVVDCGNGVASVAAPTLFRALGCEVTDLYCEVNGSFPNHHPDPSNPENMRALIKKVREQGADLGIAFDGDGDRLGIVDSQGKIIWPDRLLMLLARDILMRQPGADVVYDVKSSRHLAGEILTSGGRPIMWRSGHSLIKAKMKETGALLGGELTGHIYIKERWYGFDDALYAGARLLEIISAEGLSSTEVFAALPESVSTPELSAPTPEAAQLMERLTGQVQFPGAKLITIDGIRAEFEDGWGLVRPSNTTPLIMFRFEADDETALARIQGIFREQISGIAPELDLPF